MVDLLFIGHSKAAWRGPDRGSSEGGNGKDEVSGVSAAPAQGSGNTGGIAWQSVAASTQGQGKFYFTRIPDQAEIKKVFDNVNFTVVALKENQSLREFAGLAK